MSERYSRLFSLPTNLYTAGSPVLIAAGALLRDNQTGKVLAQLKFRNISQKAIQSVKVKVNAYDTASCPLAGVDAFSYLDLSIAAGEEFGQSKPIYLPDATTRAFTVEILSVVFADHEVFTPVAASIAKAAPKEIIEEVQRVEAEKEAIEEEQKRARTEKIMTKRSRWMMAIGFISLASVLLSIFLYANFIGLPFRWVIRRYSVRFLLALVVPCLCLLASFAGKKKKAVIKTAFLICLVLFILQIASIIGYTVLIPRALASEALYNLKETIFRYVNGATFGLRLQYLLDALGRVLDGGPVRFLTRALAEIAPSFFEVLPNLLCTAVLAVSSKKIK